MGLTGDFGKLGGLQKALRDLGLKNGAGQTMIARAVAKELQGLLVEEFQNSEGPLGKWQATKRGKSALVSRKLGNSFKALIIPGGVYVYSNVEWIAAHQEGHSFPSRRSGGNEMFFSGRNRLISAKRAAKAKNFHTVKSRAHSVGARELPARVIVPNSSSQITTKWAERINRGAEEGAAKWYEKSTG